MSSRLGALDGVTGEQVAEQLATSTQSGESVPIDRSTGRFADLVGPGCQELGFTYPTKVVLGIDPVPDGPCYFEEPGAADITRVADLDLKAQLTYQYIRHPETQDEIELIRSLACHDSWFAILVQHRLEPPLPPPQRPPKPKRQRLGPIEPQPILPSLFTSEETGLGLGKLGLEHPADKDGGSRSSGP